MDSTTLDDADPILKFVGLRLAVDVLERVDDLVRAENRARPARRTKRSHVLRELIAKGLEAA